MLAPGPSPGHPTMTWLRAAGAPTATGLRTAGDPTATELRAAGDLTATELRNAGDPTAMRCPPRRASGRAGAPHTYPSRPSLGTLSRGYLPSARWGSVAGWPDGRQLLAKTGRPSGRSHWCLDDVHGIARTRMARPPTRSSAVCPPQPTIGRVERLNRTMCAGWTSARSRVNLRGEHSEVLTPGQAWQPPRCRGWARSLALSFWGADPF
jgi:hypothetical protein